MARDFELTRRASLAVLQPFGIVVPEHLPVLGEGEVARHRPLDEIVERVQAMYGVLAVVEGAPFDMVERSLADRGLNRWLSERERAYFDARRRGEDPERRRVELSWRTECMLALGWALRLFDDLPLTGTQVAPAEAFEPLDPKGFGSGADPSIRLRPIPEIAARLDLLYCAHWAVRENQLTGRFEPWPADLVPGAIWERRHALEWIFDTDADDWDDVDLST